MIKPHDRACPYCEAEYDVGDFHAGIDAEKLLRDDEVETFECYQCGEEFVITIDWAFKFRTREDSWEYDGDDDRQQPKKEASDEC